MGELPDSERACHIAPFSVEMSQVGLDAPERQNEWLVERPLGPAQLQIYGIEVRFSARKRREFARNVPLEAVIDDIERGDELLSALARQFERPKVRAPIPQLEETARPSRCREHRLCDVFIDKSHQIDEVRRWAQ